MAGDFYTYKQQAYRFALSAHAGQTRRGLPDPYIEHPHRVALAATLAGLSDEAVAAAYLHDVAEDTPRTTADMAAAGFRPRTVELVSLLTKWWGLSVAPDAVENKAEYYRRILTDPDAIALKLLDRADNLDDMRRVSADFVPWARAYFKKTGEEFAALRNACDNLAVAGRFDKAYTALGLHLGTLR